MGKIKPIHVFARAGNLTIIVYDFTRGNLPPYKGVQNKPKVKIGNYELFLGGVSTGFLRRIVLSSARGCGIDGAVKLLVLEIFFTLCFWISFSWQFDICVISFAKYAYWVSFGEANLKRNLNLNGAGLLVLRNSRPKILVSSLDSLAINIDCNV